MRTIEIMNPDGTKRIGVIDVMKAGRYIGIDARDEGATFPGEAFPSVGLSLDVAEAAQLIAALSAAIAEQYNEDEARRPVGPLL